jgi:hypothetical protein
LGQARLSQGPTVDNVIGGSTNLQITLTLLGKERGEVIFDESLRVIRVESATQNIPIFAQPIPVSQGGASAPVGEVPVAGADSSLHLWSRSFEAGGGFVCEARAKLATGEILWLGQSGAKWALLHGTLWGISPAKDGRILLRAAVPAENAKKLAPEGITANWAEVSATIFPTTIVFGLRDAVKELGSELGSWVIGEFAPSGNLLVGSFGGDGLIGQFAIDPSANSVTVSVAGNSKVYTVSTQRYP